MILKKFEYKEFSGTPNAWSLNDLTLGEINLLVGKNATGKTNTINKIVWLAEMLSGLKPVLSQSANYCVEFSDDDAVYKYHLSIYTQNIIFEKLEINDDVKFERGSDGKGHIDTTQFDEGMDFQLSPNQLVVTSKRDAIQHPYLQKIYDWAIGHRFYEFGLQMGQNTIMMMNNIDNINVDPHDMNAVVGLYMQGDKEFPKKFKKCVKNAMKDIGYELRDIGIVGPFWKKWTTDELKSIQGGPLPFMFCLNEKDSSATIVQQQISRGMFRALSLIIQLIYNSLKKAATTVLIDDIGEGLDYDRSSKLIKLIINLADESGTQLIMSTNDRFVMNNVPLEYWQVIQRKGGECHVSNSKNSKKFDEFEYTGLNNFDFLRTDFINSNWESV
jgi:ABC-type transporter Mla maintaining outer membrane lipid asymmetry ATPase subunit MlaF